jgi:hypothetical protein
MCRQQAANFLSFFVAGADHLKFFMNDPYREMIAASGGVILG